MRRRRFSDDDFGEFEDRRDWRECGRDEDIFDPCHDDDCECFDDDDFFRDGCGRFQRTSREIGRGRRHFHLVRRHDDCFGRVIDPKCGIRTGPRCIG